MKILNRINDWIRSCFETKLDTNIRKQLGHYRNSLKAVQDMIENTIKKNQWYIDNNITDEGGNILFESSSESFYGGQYSAICTAYKINKYVTIDFLLERGTLKDIELAERIRNENFVSEIY